MRDPDVFEADEWTQPAVPDHELRRHPHGGAGATHRPHPRQLFEEALGSRRHGRRAPPTERVRRRTRRRATREFFADDRLRRPRGCSRSRRTRCKLRAHAVVDPAGAGAGVGRRGADVRVRRPAPAVRRSASGRELLLDGVRVIEFGVAAVVPEMCGVLSELGADVIKIESTANLDVLRMGSGSIELIDKSFTFNDECRGRRSVALDLTTERGRELALALCASADVVAENQRGGALERRGLGYDAVRGAQPACRLRLVAGLRARRPVRRDARLRTAQLRLQRRAPALEPPRRAVSVRHVDEPPRPHRRPAARRRRARRARRTRGVGRGSAPRARADRGRRLPHRRGVPRGRTRRRRPRCRSATRTRTRRRTACTRRPRATTSGSRSLVAIPTTTRGERCRSAVGWDDELRRCARPPPTASPTRDELDDRLAGGRARARRKRRPSSSRRTACRRCR